MNIFNHYLFNFLSFVVVVIGFQCMVNCIVLAQGIWEFVVKKSEDTSKWKMNTKKKERN